MGTNADSTINPGSLAVRAATDRDVAALTAAHPDHGPTYFADLLAQQTEGRGQLLVAWLDSRPVGTVHIRLGPADDPAHLPLLQHAHVVPAARNRGIGTKLVQEAEEWVRARRYRHVAVTVPPADSGTARFYERLGFQRRQPEVLIKKLAARQPIIAAALRLAERWPRRNGRARTAQLVVVTPHDPPPKGGGIVPYYRILVAVDIEKSTTRTNTERARLRVRLYELFEEALRASGIEKSDHEELVDRGDGILVIIHSVDRIPKTLPLATFIPTLTALLSRHNDSEPESAFRLRAVVHAGEVHADPNGWYGEAVDLAFRLLEAPEVKQSLADSDANLVLVVSNDIYESVVRQRYEGIDADAFAKLVRVRLGERSHDGWVTAPKVS